MTDKELRKLKRDDLIELLLAQSRAADEREAELNALRQEMENRRIEIAEAGSIAEASLRLNRVFEAAQAAADQYLANFADVEERTRTMEEASRESCLALERESRRACQEQEEETRRRCEEMLRDAETRSRQYWDEAKAKMDGYISDHRELQNLFRQTVQTPAPGPEQNGTGT